MTETAATHPAAPLDEVMLAMDVVDTLRQRRELVERELDEPARAQDLIARLRKIYAAQGIDVPDEILAKGVAALAEERFVYRPAPPSVATTLARIYVRRRRWGTALVAVAAVCTLIVGAYRNQVVGPRRALPAELDAAHAVAVQVATVPAATERANALLASAQAALRDRDYAAARQDLTGLHTLQATLERTYAVRIVNRPGEASGVWRVPDINPSARNYYLIVEAVGPDGGIVPVTVRNEETGATETVRRWGLRVDEPTFQAVARDKQDDGIIQNDAVGEKLRGALEARYSVPTSGATITRW
jgi:anti-sigma-K factor RskA